jgi:hypothetical protein
VGKNSPVYIHFMQFVEIMHKKIAYFNNQAKCPNAFVLRTLFNYSARARKNQWVWFFGNLTLAPLFFNAVNTKTEVS